LTQVKTHLRVDGSDDDAELTLLLSAARAHVESRTNRQLMQATYQMTFDRWPAGGVATLRMPPLLSVTSVTYYDESAVSQTLSASKYHVDTASEPGRIVLDDGESWPALDVRPAAATITFVAGVASADDVPDAAKLATLQLVGHWFENREAIAFGGNPVELPHAVEALINQIKVPELS
tara:strand:+ start:236 stop:769 length:534 start_codon:yes stop_codon:yes gene_type:complete